MQAVSAKVSVSENDFLHIVAFKEVLKWGISQWKFPANISHKKHKTTFHNPVDTPPGNIKIASAVTKELRKENPNFMFLHFAKTMSKLDLPASAFRYKEKLHDITFMLLIALQICVPAFWLNIL